MATRNLSRWLSVGAIVAALLVYAAWWQWQSPSMRLARSVASVPQRIVRGRLSGFEHRPSQQKALAGVNLALVRAVAASVASDPDAEPHLSTIAKLLAGRMTEAVRDLEALVAAQPSNVVYWSDLAAARLENGETEDDPRMIALALVAADRALTIERNHPEALFNRAAALEALGLDFAAAETWRRYLVVDSGSPWASEARVRLQAAEAPTRDDAWTAAKIEIERAAERRDHTLIETITRRHPQRARMFIESVYLPRWGTALLKGDGPQAEQWLFLARSAADALHRFNGDRLLRDAVAAIDGGSDLRTLAHAHVTYGRGRDNYSDRKFQESLPRFAEAEAEFAALKHPMALVAAYYRGNALVDLGQPAEAARIARDLESRTAPSYRSLHAHRLWLEARLTNDGGRMYETLVIVSVARESFEKLGEVDHAARLRTGEAAMLARLGRDRDAWRARRAALTEAADAGQWNLVEVAIEAIARDEIDGPNADIARSLLDVQVAAPSSLPLMRFNGLLWRAYLDARTSGTAPDLSAARAAATRIPDPKQRADAMDELRLAEALAEREREPAAAEIKLGEVIDYRVRQNLLPHLPSIHLQRGRIRRALGRVADAERDFLDAIELTESRRTTIRNDTLRDTFLGHWSEAYTDLADLLLEQGQWQRAFDIAERARSRILLDRIGQDAVSLAEVVDRTPEGIVAAHYTTLPSQTLLVVIRDGKATHHRIGAGREELRSLRDRLTAAIARDAHAEAEQLAERLYALLIEPLTTHLREKLLLVIVPDESTYGIPFAALRHTREPFLMQQIALAIAPTAAAIASDPNAPFRRGSSVTVLTDPAFSTRLFPDLERLPAARRDAPRFDAGRSPFVQFSGPDATPDALRGAAPGSDVIHIAAHALSSERDALQSLIVLAASDRDGGVLDLQEIASLNLQQRRPLVVLAGCQTGSLGGGNGSIRTLAHAFLAAGSSAVLATLWNVDDRAASGVTSLFYRHLAAGLPAPAALREAQFQAMQSEPLREWAAFQIHIGVRPVKVQ